MGTSLSFFSPMPSFRQAFRKFAKKYARQRDARANNPEIFKGLSGIIRKSSVEKVFRAFADMEAFEAKQAAEKKRKEQKFINLLEKNADKISDADENLRARIKTKFPHLFERYFGE